MFSLSIIVPVMNKYIFSDPKIMGGIPVVRGTRVPVGRIIFLLKEGYTVENIHDMYPHISLPTIAGTVNEVIHQIDSQGHASKTSSV